MSIMEYKDPIIINWNVDQDGKRVSVQVLNEQIQIIDGKAVLGGIPDEQYRVQITGYVEIGLKEKLTQSNQFKVDYTNAYVLFNSTIGDLSLTVNKYYSRGNWSIPSSRVWHKLSINGEVSQTLDDAMNIIDSELIQKTHIHPNKTVIDKLSEANGGLVYNGKAIGGATLGSVQPTDGSTWLKVIG